MAAQQKDRIEALMKERIAMVPYDDQWPVRYAELELKLKKMFPRQLVQRIAHIGSTAVPGLSAKPIIDVQVEVSDLDLVQRDVVPVLEAEGYEFIWRPTIGEHAPFYAWFILRNEKGERIQHIHFVSPDQASVDRIVFRDYLRRHPEESASYEALKKDLAVRFPKDRAAYTQGKTDYINAVLLKARSEKIKKK